MRTTLAIACLAALAGCAAYDGYSLRAGTSTETELRTVMGPPAAEFASADGSKRLAYPRGPLGTHTYMADVGRDGVLVGVKNVLNDDTFNAIRPGLARDDVLRMIGPPGDTMFFPRLGHTAWDYRYRDTWGYLAIFSVTFDSNWVVVSKITSRVERERGRD